MIQVKERPVLAAYQVIGADKVSPKDVRERLAFPTGVALDPAKIASAMERTDSLYESKGYYLARVQPESSVVNGRLKINFRIDEGRRLAISGIRINGNTRVSDGDVVGAMETKPEGFLWTRETASSTMPYTPPTWPSAFLSCIGSRGFIDFRILKDTLIVDRERGKGLIDITVEEGPRYASAASR